MELNIRLAWLPAVCIMIVRAGIDFIFKVMARSLPLNKVFFVFCILLTNLALADQKISSDERKIKTAYLYHLMKFVAWPDDHANRPGETVNICVAADTEFTQLLSHLELRNAKDRPIKIIPITSTQKPPSCQLVFYQSGTLGNRAQLQQFSELGTLTVGENKSLIHDGAMISMIVANQGVRLYVNLGLVKKAGIMISANLLEISTIVE